MLKALLVYDKDGRHIAIDVEDSKTGIQRVLRVEDMQSTIDIKGVQLCKTGKVRVDANIPRVDIMTAQYALYTGPVLNKYINTKFRAVYKQRNVVKNIVDYLRSDIGDRVFALSGLRGVGKTVALLQSIQEVNDYNNSLYITIQQPMSFDKLIELLQKFEHKHYIFIDEISEVEDIIDRSKYLADVVCSNETKIVISGTDSLIFSLMPYQGLYHRCISHNITYKGFLEAKRVQSLDFEQYYKTGGIFEPDRFNDVTAIYNYTDTAILNNICHTLQRNKIVRWSAIRELSETAVRTLLFRLMYAIIYSFLSKSVFKATNIARYINNYEGVSDYAILQDAVFASIGIDNTIVVKEQAVNELLEVLLNLGIIIGVPNFNNMCDTNYYFVNSAITMQISKALVEAMDKTPDISRTEKWTLQGVYGLIFESTVMCNVYMMSKRRGYDVYFYRKDNTSEVDIIIEYESEDVTKGYVLCEVKLTKDMDTAIIKSKWLNIVDIELKNKGNICGKYVLYQGETGVFNGFKSNDMIGTKTESVEEIEKRNKGTICVNIEDFLTNFDTFVKFKC